MSEPSPQIPTEALFRLLIEQVADYAIYMLDPEGRVVSWNAGAQRLKGYRAEEILGKNFSLFYPADAARAGKPQEELRRALRDGRVSDEGWRVRKDGSQFYAHVVVTALHDAQGELRGFGKVTRDVTEFEALRRRTERVSVFKDAEKLALLDTVLEQSPQGVIVTDPLGRFVIQNRAAERIWGGSVTVDEQSAWSKYRTFGPDGAPLEPEQWPLARCLRRREVVPPEEQHIQRFDGAHAWILTSSAPVLSPEGKLLGAVSVFADVTEQREGRARLALLQERLEVTLKSIGDAVIATDERGTVTFLNRVAERLTGWTSDEAQGRPLAECFQIINEQTRRAVEDPVAKVVKEGRTVGLANHTILIAKDGKESAIADSAAPIRDQGGQLLGVVLVFRDVSEERVAEKALRESQDRLKEADRRKDEFLAMLAHELRNPLAPIATASQLLAARIGERPELRRPVEVLGRQIQHLAKLVDDLLEVSRITRGKIRLDVEPLDAAAVVHRAVELSRPLIDAKKHALTVSVPPEPVWINADATRLAQVLGNLLNNAAKYTEQGGQISIALERKGPRVVFRVRDDGIGIAPELMPRLFQLFAQADTSLDRAQGGLGIGLTLARGLVELHEGKLEAKSDGPGKGSEFTVELPAAHERPRVRDQDEVFTRLATAPPTRILIVDDNIDAAETLEDLLRESGHTVTVVYDGLTAVETVRGFRPEVVLLDIGLPKMDGYQVAQRLRQEHGDGIVLVALTGYGQAEDRHRAKSVGFDHHLVKPLDLLALSDVLARRRARG